MSLNFPSRFLKKLEIYQQIRSGQGISKHKHLWKYEAAFLQYSYEDGHQHLSDFVSRTNLGKKWIASIIPFNPSKERYNHILGNLFWRGYIDVTKRDKKNKKLFIRNSQAYTSNSFGRENLDFRPTMEGLLVGEVLSEINSKNRFLHFLNNYKYSWMLDMIWFLGFFGLYKLLLPEEYQCWVENITFDIGFGVIDYKIIILLTIFIIWPSLSFLYRTIYSKIER